MKRMLSVLLIGMLVVPHAVTAQDAHPDRFGLGASGEVGWFGDYSGTFVGGEGFVRVARGAFWRARVDAAYFGAMPHTGIVCALQGNPQSCDTRYLGQLGTVIATLTLGPTASDGLQPFYGLLGVGGAATRWGGGYYEPPSGTGQPLIHGSGTGPSFALLEAGMGAEFRALGNDRIEFRVNRVSASLPSGASSAPGKIGVSLTIGRVW